MKSSQSIQHIIKRWEWRWIGQNSFMSITAVISYNLLKCLPASFISHSIAISIIHHPAHSHNSGWRRTVHRRLYWFWWRECNLGRLMKIRSSFVTFITESSSETSYQTVHRPTVHVVLRSVAMMMVVMKLVKWGEGSEGWGRQRRRGRRRGGSRRRRLGGDCVKRRNGGMDEWWLVGRGLIGEDITYLVKRFLRLGKVFTVRKMNGGIGKNLLIDELLHSRYLITDTSDVKGG